MRLRPATMDDAELLLAWANDVDTRGASFNRPEISLEAHEMWLSEVLADPRRRLWIGVDAAGHPIGQARLDRVDGEEVISVSLAPEARGRGLATPLILQACEHAQGIVRAEIRRDNVRSRRAFEAAGFVIVTDDLDRVVMSRASC